MDDIESLSKLLTERFKVSCTVCGEAFDLSERSTGAIRGLHKCAYTSVDMYIYEKELEAKLK